MYDGDQLQPEDTLANEPTGDVLDSGYAPADSDLGRRLDRLVERADEPERPDTLEERLAQEEREDPELPGRTVTGQPAAGVPAGDLVDETLVAEASGPGQDDLAADERGPLLDAAAPEEAMHLQE